VEYSPPVIYEYFDSKDEILLELVRQGYAEQLEAVERAGRSARDPEEALLGVGRAWLDFAFESPDLYQVMYGLGGVSFPVTELQKEGEKIAKAIGQTIEEALKVNGKEAEDVRDKVMLLWGMAHGLVSLAMAGRIVGGFEETGRLADKAAHDYMSAWLKS
jgi:AcrR family transcriptional regulator